MKQNNFDKLLAFLNNLEQAHIHYTLGHHREQAVMVTVAIPGQRWEIEFMQDGPVEVERFVSGGDIEDESALQDLFTIYADNSWEEQPTNGDRELALATEEHI